MSESLTNVTAATLQASELQQWWQEPIGRHLLGMESRLLNKHLEHAWGQRSLQLSSYRDFIGVSMEKVGISVTAGCTDMSTDKACVLDPGSLPFDQSCMDAVVLHHVLEFSSTPHAVLREASRVLNPYGRLTICGVNRYSLLSGRLRATGFPSRQHNASQYISEHRLRDWMDLLGFSVESCHYCFFIPPFNRERWLSYEHRLSPSVSRWLSAIGGAYVITARKEVAGMTPLRQRWPLFSQPLTGLRATAQASARWSHNKKKDN